MNYAGIKTNPTWEHPISDTMLSSGRAIVETPDGPDPQSEDWFEWQDIKRAVDEAEGTFRMIEAGAGYGRWAANAIGYLRNTRPGMPYQVLAVEANPTRFRWMQEHFAANRIEAVPILGFIRGMAGMEPAISNVSDYGARNGMGPPVPVYHLMMLVAMLGGEVDLIDMDIQGAEGDVIESAQKWLHLVKNWHIGTHNGRVETEIRRAFNGWANVWDFSCGRTCQTPNGPISFVDGISSWKRA